jgi:hypothetical protein
MDPLNYNFAWQNSKSNIGRCASRQTHASGFSVVFRALLGVLLLAAGALRANADALDNWQWRNPLPEGNTLTSVAYGGGNYVAVGEGGTILVSPDGVNWSDENTGTQSLTGVSYVNGEFLSLGASGAILSSTDGFSWTPESSGTSATLYGAAYDGSSTYVIVGAGGAILSSTDSVNWTPQNSTVTTNLYSVVYALGEFVAVGDAGTIVYSPDGANWTETPADTTNALTSVAYGINDIIAVGPQGDIVSSSDGVNWTEDGPIGNLSCIVFANNAFVALGANNTVVSSTDGAGFSTTVSGPDGLPASIAYGPAGLVSVGTDLQSSYGTISTSPDGNTWTLQSSGVTYQNLNGMAYNGTTFVGAGANGTLVTSANGVTWATVFSGTTVSLNAVTSGSTQTVVVGAGCILSSADAQNWRSDTLPVTTTYNGAAFGGGTYVAVGNNGTILSSTDGLTWTSETSGVSATLYGAAYGNGTFVAVGLGGAAVSSPDGVNWTSNPTGTGLTLTGVAFQNGGFVAVGLNGTILTSSNGTTWTPSNSGVTAMLTGIAAGDGYFLAVGARGTLLSSTDAITWTLRDPSVAAAQQLNGVGYGYGTFVAVGTVGTIIQSQAIPGVGPIVTTGSAGSITTTTAVLNGLVDTNGTTTTTAFFEYGTNPTLAGAAVTSSTTLATGTGISVSGSVGGLTPGTTYYFAIVAENANAEEVGEIQSFATLPIAPVITSPVVASGTNGEPFSYQIVATFNPTSYGASGLPSGLTVSSSTGLISGTPTEFGNFSVALSAVNTGGTGTAMLSLRLVEPALPVVNSPLTANGSVGFPFNYQISASNGPTSYGALGLPAGLTVDPSTGLISGTPTQAGQVSVTISGSNARGSGSASLTVTLLPQPPAITSNTSASATDGQTFFYQITATNFPSSYALTGSLPQGLSFDTSRGVLVGTPTVSGTFTLGMAASNAGGTGTDPLILFVLLPPPPVVTSTTSVTGTDGVGLQYQINATNNPTSFSATGLPPGLQYNTTTGQVNGVPSASGTFAGTISAINAGGTGSSVFTVTVLPPLPTITSAVVATGSNGVPFSYQIVAINGPKTYGASGLPTGLSVNTTTGLISGSPSGTGLVKATISAANDSGTSYKTLAVELAVNASQTAGAYDGLASVGGTNVGMVSLTLSAKGTYTGKLSLAGLTYTLKGPITSYGALSGYAEEKGSTVQVFLNANPTGPAVSGSISATTGGAVTNYTIAAMARGVFKAGVLSPSLVGRYTVVIPAISGTDVRTPHAPGYATLTVSTKGAISLVGKLGDGTPISIASQLHADQKTWTLFKALYAGTRPGTIAGLVTFESEAGSDADASLDWIKPLQTKPGYYPGGFLEDVDLMAAKYTPPPLTSGTGSITIAGGNLGQTTITNPFSIASNGKITATGTNGTTASIAVKTGAFSGAFRFPVTNKKTSFGGVIYQKPAPPAGFGLFLGPSLSGGVEIDQ